MITRRTFIKRSAQAGIVTAAVPSVLSSLFAFEKQSPLALQELRIPPIISGGEITIAPGTNKIFSDTDTNLLLINNLFVGPTIKIKKGNAFSATIHNNLTEETVLHWHGIHAPATMSGHPKSAVGPGSSYSVNFPVYQRACTSFYHAHPDMNTGRQVYMGIAGLFIVEDDEEKLLGLPSGEYDIPLLLQDKRFDENHQLIYTPTEQDKLSGWLGETILVNGTPNAFLSVAPTLYRFRLVNGSNARFYKVALSDGKAFTAISNDGGFLEAPVSLTDALIGPGERLEILVDFSTYSQGETITLRTLKFTFSDGPGTGKIPQGAEMDLVQFQVTKAGSSASTIPTVLPTIEKFNAADVMQTRVWDFAALHHINEMPYDINRIDATVQFGKLEKWRFDSEAANTHPIHVHGAFFQVLNRDDGIPPEPIETGWKDTVRLNPLKNVEVLVKFSDYAGLFLIHCHKLEHSDAGMMANFEVSEAGSVNERESENSFIDIYPNPASDHAVLTFPMLTTEEALIIVDMQGNIIQKELLSANTQQYRMQTTSIPSGSYKILLANSKATLIIQR